MDFPGESSNEMPFDDFFCFGCSVVCGLQRPVWKSAFSGESSNEILLMTLFLWGGCSAVRGLQSAFLGINWFSFVVLHFSGFPLFFFGQKLKQTHTHICAELKGPQALNCVLFFSSSFFAFFFWSIRHRHCPS